MDRYTGNYAVAIGMDLTAVACRFASDIWKQFVPNYCKESASEVINCYVRTTYVIILVHISNITESSPIHASVLSTSSE